MKMLEMRISQSLGVTFKYDGKTRWVLPMMAGLKPSGIHELLGFENNQLEFYDISKIEDLNLWDHEFSVSADQVKNYIDKGNEFAQIFVAK